MSHVLYQILCIYIYIYNVYNITSLAADRPPRAPGVKSCLEGCLLERGSTEGRRASATTYTLRIATSHVVTITL